MRSQNRTKEVGSVGVIKSNPDQSKHLETATVKVIAKHGYPLDPIQTFPISNDSGHEEPPPSLLLQSMKGADPT